MAHETGLLQTAVSPIWRAFGLQLMAYAAAQCEDKSISADAIETLGNVQPPRADEAITRKIEEALPLIDVRVLDACARS